jgi:hypothetical protein
MPAFRGKHGKHVDYRDSGRLWFWLCAKGSLVSLAHDSTTEKADEMTASNWMTVAVGVYVGLFIMAVAGFVLWRVKRRRERPPLEFKLLRGPGETLRRRVAKFDEDALIRIGGAAIAPLVAVFVPLWLFTKFKPQNWTQLSLWLAVMAVVFVGVLILSFRWAIRDFGRYRNDRLGYLGERAVGEALLSIHEAGYRIFHDVPASVNKRSFNVDHVAVGPGGVFAIETKTRRKGRARPGFEDHKVAYDGQQLIWPWGEDDFGLRNAEDRARWLSNWLNEKLGLGLSAKPMLVLPGWYVVPKGIGSVLVVNHKQVVGTILRQSQSVLDKDKIDLVARQLDGLCRDVED